MSSCCSFSDVGIFEFAVTVKGPKYTGKDLQALAAPMRVKVFTKTEQTDIKLVGKFLLLLYTLLSTKHL